MFLHSYHSHLQTFNLWVVGSNPTGRNEETLGFYLGFLSFKASPSLKKGSAVAIVVAILAVLEQSEGFGHGKQGPHFVGGKVLARGFPRCLGGTKGAHPRPGLVPFLGCACVV